MALNFDYSKVKDHEVVTTHPEDIGKDPDKERVRYNPVFNQLVWSMMVIGVSRITEDNLEKVQDRIAQYQKAMGPCLSSGAIGGIYVTDADVARYVGLSTNVSQMTDAQWLKHLGEMMLREASFRAPTSHSPNVSAYDLSEYLSIKREDGTYYVE